MLPWSLQTLPRRWKLLLRLGLMTGGLLFLGFVGAYGMSSPADLWPAFVLLVIDGLLVGAILFRFNALLRSAPAELKWSARWSVAARHLALLAYKPLPAHSLARAVLDYRVEGRSLATLFAWVIVPLALATVPVSLLGRLSARSDTDFMVTGDKATWIAVRRYGDRIVAMRNNPTSTALTRDFRILPLADTLRVWSHRHFDRLEVSSRRGTRPP